MEWTIEKFDKIQEFFGEPPVISQETACLCFDTPCICSKEMITQEEFDRLKKRLEERTPVEESETDTK